MKTPSILLFFILFSSQLAFAQAPEKIAKDAGKIGKSSTKLMQKQKRLRAVPNFGSPKSLFTWMKKNLRFEPYSGSVRGPRGVLISGGGNSVDLALLAAGELKDRKYKVKFEVVDWERKAAERAMDSFVGSATLLAAKPIPKSESSDGILTQLPSRRVYVSVFHKNRWNAFDVVGSSEYGVTKDTQNKETLDEMPEEMLGTFKFRVTATLKDGQHRKLFDESTALNEIGVADWRLAFEPKASRKGTIIPVLSVGTEQKRGEEFPASELDTMTLRIVVRQSGLERQMKHTIYDATIGQKFEEANVLLSLHAFGTWVDFDWSSAQAAGRILASTNAVQAWSGERLSGLAEGDPREIRFLNSARAPLGDAVALAYVGTLDSVTRELARTMGVQPYISQPRVIVVTSSATKTGLDYRITPLGGQFDSVPKNGIPERVSVGFRSTLGAVEAIVRQKTEARFGGADAPWFEAKQKLGGVITIDASGYDKVAPKINRSQKLKLREHIRFGDVVLSGKPIEASPGWWVLSPESGSLEGLIPGVTASLFKDPKPTTNTAELAASIVTSAANALDIFRKRAPLVGSKKTVCSAKKHLDFSAGAFCATGRKLGGPSLQSCLKPPEMESGVFTKKGCAERTKDFRCGAVIADALLGGELTVLYSSGQTPFEIMSASGKKKSVGKATGITCKN